MELIAGYTNRKILAAAKNRALNLIKIKIN